MTLRTSWFNRGIYKSTVRRFAWGSVLYVILLFLSTGLPILFSRHHFWVGDTPLILDDVYFYFPLMTAMIVPTVVALLVYRVIHSKKTSVFVHSLPVSRTANYLSTLAAALTLMAVPIILNGAILMLISMCGYGILFDITSCLIWVGVNLLAVFLMFSVATFAAFLTGNSFAMVALNGLLHLIAVIFAGGISALGNLFLYGYYESGELLNLAADWNFVWYLGNFDFGSQIPFDIGKMVLMLICAAVLYFAAWLLYRKRRMETAEDVAAYKCLNPIFKYLLTFIGAVAAFLLVSETLEKGILSSVIVVLLISAVVYFSSEMILKKNLKVWKSYKGYLVFLVVLVAFLSFFAFTGVFGFETRIPDGEKVEAVAVTENAWYEGMPFVEVEAIEEYTLALHEELVQKENLTTLYQSSIDRPRLLFLTYRMKNGKVMMRRYFVSEEMLCRVMDDLYQWNEYKLANIDVFREVSGEISGIDVGPIEINEPEKVDALMTCLTADLLELDYSEMRSDDVWDTSLQVEYEPEEDEEDDESYRRVYNAYQSVNANFTRTMAWLKEHGLWNTLFNSAGYDLAVLDAQQWKAYVGEPVKTVNESSERYYLVETTVAVKEERKFDDIPRAVRITDTAAKNALREIALTTPVRYVPGKEPMYYLCSIDGAGYVNKIAAFYDDASGISKYQK